MPVVLENVLEIVHLMLKPILVNLLKCPKAMMLNECDGKIPSIMAILKALIMQQSHRLATAAKLRRPDLTRKGRRPRQQPTRNAHA